MNSRENIVKILEEKQENIVQNTPENSRIKSWKYRLRESARKYSGIKSKNERKYSKDYTKKQDNMMKYM